MCVDHQYGPSALLLPTVPVLSPAVPADGHPAHRRQVPLRQRGIHHPAGADAPGRADAGGGQSDLRRPRCLPVGAGRAAGAGRPSVLRHRGPVGGHAIQRPGRRRQHVPVAVLLRHMMAYSHTGSLSSAMVGKASKFEAASSTPCHDFSTCTFFLKTIQGAAFKLLCDVLKDIVHDVTLRVDGNGITCNCIEGSKTCYVNMVLHADRFDVFHCPLQTDISLSMEQLSTLTGMCGHNDQLSIYQERANTDVVVVLIESQTQESVMKKSEGNGGG
ncbi:MAG: hypothetical protein EOO40_09850, partial [Deltaproteobacteria bacterium]